MSSNPALAIYDFIARYRAAHAFSPAIFDIAIGCRMSTKAVHVQLDAMEEAGYIRRRKASLVPLRRPTDVLQARTEG